MELFFRQAGSGPPIVILHGLFGSCDNWLTISKIIAEKGYSVFAIDQRNHGRSPHSDKFNYQLLAQDLYDFLIRHQIEKPILIGHSMGGKTVMNFAMWFPDMFSKLVIVDMATKHYEVDRDDILKGLFAINLDEIKTRTEADEIFSRYEPDLGVRQFLLKNLYKNEEDRFAWRINLPILAENMVLIGDAVPNKRAILEPVLFMRGEKSQYVLDADVEEIKKLFPNFVLDTIQNAGHWVHAEQPQGFLDSLFYFLKK